MRELALASQFDSRVVWFARSVVAAAPDGFDKGGYVRAIRACLVRLWRYTYDARDADVLVPPREMIDRLPLDGEFRGDCDENACLAAGLGLSVGIETQLVMCAFHDPNAAYSHIWAELFDGHAWQSMDCSAPANAAGAISRYEVIPV